MNRLISASQVAKEIVASIDEAQKDLTDAERREFMRELVEWLYQLNGFPPSGPKDN
jgi:hypothetical protein